MKICVITPRWSISGVPLAQRRFAMALAKAGHDVDLVVGRKDADTTIPDTPGVKLILWDAAGVRRMVRPVMRYLKSVRPDIVFSAEDHLNGAVLLAAILSGSKAKISGSSRVSPYDTYSNIPLTRKWTAKQLLRSVMWRADALTCVSKDMVDQYKTIFPNGPHTDVYNIVVDESSVGRRGEPVDHPWFVDRDLPIVAAAGTLTTRKAFDDLVTAVGLLRSRGRIVRLVIFGEGHMRAELETIARKLGISDEVWLPGRVDNPLKYFAHSDIVALSSLAEGLPNVLVEGMLCGCTPVSTDCPTGPDEVLEGGKNGYLVPMRDPEALADGIAAALDRPTPRERLDKAIEPFTEKAVLARHFEVLGLGEGG